MKIVVLYRPNSEHGRVVEDFIHDFQSRHLGQKMDVLNIDSREGASLASLYEIMEYPAIMVTQNDGGMQKLWQGTSLPLIDEVAAYARA